MKKNVVILLLIVASVLAIGFLIPNKQEAEYELIRIHIRANSNEKADQTVKYAVRNSVVAYLTPLLQNVETREGAFRILEQELDSVESLATDVLKENGFGYKAKATLLTEYFPTRLYEDITVESGYYDALVLELGDGTGDNWWCVVYPPLCFLGSSGEGKIKYKSKLLEMLKKK